MSGESRGFAFVRYNYVAEAWKAVDWLDGNMTFTMLKDDYYNTLKMTIAIIKNYDYLLAYLWSYLEVGLIIDVSTFVIWILII